MIPACPSFLLRSASRVRKPCLRAFRLPGWPPRLRGSFGVVRQAAPSRPAECDVGPVPCPAVGVRTLAMAADYHAARGHSQGRRPCGIRCRGAWRNPNEKGGLPPRSGRRRGWQISMRGCRSSTMGSVPPTPPPRTRPWGPLQRRWIRPNAIALVSVVLFWFKEFAHHLGRVGTTPQRA